MNAIYLPGSGSVSLRTLVLSCLSIILFSPQLLFGQRTNCYSRQEGKKWGVFREDYENGEYIKKWAFKPRWELVTTDSTSCFGKSECKGFFTWKGGKMGYAWCDGTVLENEYDALNIRGNCGKKNGKWGGLDRNELILPFEYDSLNDLYFAQGYWTNATRKSFAALKNGTWELVVVRQPYEAPPVIEPKFNERYEDIKDFENGAALKQNGKWRYADFRKMDAPVYSQPFDSISRVTWHNTVKVNDKWYPLEDDALKPGMDKGWDKIEKTNENSFLLAWENGQAGIIRRNNGKYDLIISPRATAARIHGEYSTGYTIELTENGQKITYTEKGQELSRTGDLSVSYTVTKGPFRIDQSKNYKYKVCDAAANTLLIPEGSFQYEYEMHPQLGHILWLKDETYPGSRNYLHGLYHYSSKTWIKPEYENKFSMLAGKYLYSKLGSGEYKLWNSADLSAANIPFKVMAAKENYQSLLKDDKGNWHELNSGFTVVPNAKVIDTRKTEVGGMEIEVYEDGSQKLLRLNGKEVNKYIQKNRWIEANNICSITVDGIEKEYFVNGNRAEECKYKLGHGVYIMKHILAQQSWPGESFPTPLIVADSAGKLILVNAFNNKRLLTPVVLSGSNILYDDHLYFLDNVYSASSITFTHTEQVKCSHCTKGYNSEVYTETVKGKVSYETVERTDYKTSTESKWNPNTDSYQYVKKTTPVTSYETIEHKDPDYEVEKTRSVKCKVCDGKGTTETTDWITWDGNTLKRATF